MRIPFRVCWKHTCFECACPLDVDILIRCGTYDGVEVFFTQLFSWMYLNPTSLLYNISMFKYYGGIPVRRVCQECYHSPLRVNLKMREVCTKPRIRRRYSVQALDLYNWFDGFDKYRKRPDLDQYLINESQLRHIPGLKYILLLTNVNS